MNITIIGGGVNGLCSAYYLNKEGYEVSVVDPGFLSDGTSYGNAGMIVPSHFIPLASPGVISKGIKWMFNSSSPFYIKPRLDPDLLRWLWKFYRSCNKKNVEKHQELIWQYNELSKKEYFKIAKAESLEFDLHQKGLLMLYKNEKSKKEEIEIAEKAAHIGLNINILDGNGVQELNPDLKIDVLGGVYYPDDGHLYSNLFMEEMKNLLLKKGVKLISSKVKSFIREKKNINQIILESEETMSPDEVVISAGVWTKNILKQIGIKLVLEDGRGYSITKKDMQARPSIPSILSNEKVAITPMGDDLRITGTLDLSNISKKINEKRVKGFLGALPKYFPDIKIDYEVEKTNIWTGYRPLSPSGVPYVGRSEKIDNLVIATGHGMMGMSLGPGTGKLISEIISGRKSEIDLSLLKVDR